MCGILRYIFYRRRVIATCTVAKGIIPDVLSTLNSVRESEYNRFCLCNFFFVGLHYICSFCWVALYLQLLALTLLLQTVDMKAG